MKKRQNRNLRTEKYTRKVFKTHQMDSIVQYDAEQTSKEIMNKNLQNLPKDINLQIQEAQ